MLAVNLATAQCVKMTVDTITTVAQFRTFEKAVKDQKIEHGLEVYYRNTSTGTNNNDLLACGCLTLVSLDSLKASIAMPTGKWSFFDSLGRVKYVGQFDVASSRFLHTQVILEDTFSKSQIYVAKFLHFIKLSGLWQVYKSPLQRIPNFYLFDNSYSKYIEFDLDTKYFSFDY
jgi:hypothetical protein